jgi:hypothetical protein
MKEKNFFWKGSYQESHERLVSSYLWDYSKSRSSAGKALIALAKGSCYPLCQES